jgi:hypothetical protein
VRQLQFEAIRQMQQYVQELERVKNMGAMTAALRQVIVEQSDEMRREQARRHATSP